MATAECKELRQQCSKLQNERHKEQQEVNADLYQKHETVMTMVHSIVSELSGIRGGLKLLNILIGIAIAVSAIYFGVYEHIHKIIPHQ